MRSPKPVSGVNTSAEACTALGFLIRVSYHLEFILGLLLRIVALDH